MDERIYLDEFRGARIAALDTRAPASAGIVVMAHGFKGSKIGPSRYFVDLSRAAAARGISSFRFDQPCSGDSEGAFEDSSFDVWIDAIEHFARRFIDNGDRVALLGSSMGGTASMIAASRLGASLRGVALWSAGPMIEDAASAQPESDWMEEEGQRVRWDFWHEAAAVDFVGAYRMLQCPCMMIFGTADEFISPSSVRAVQAVAKAGDDVRVVEGLPHSAWPEPHRSLLLADTLGFLGRVLKA
jgi:pimeloyl-ACP methyl ester carboxylesterase